MQIGALEVTPVSDGPFSLDPSRMFGPTPNEAWRRMVRVDEAGRVPAGLNCLLVRAGERRILIDTGIGRDDPPILGGRYVGLGGRLLESLGALGLGPGDVDTVVLSHAHGDHIGGATERREDRWVPTFPNARYWLWQGEWDYWTSPEGMGQIPDLANKLPPLAEHGRLELVDSEVEVAPGVRLIAAPGHTPGHVCVALTSGAEAAIYTGDLIHHPTQFDHPEWSPAFDILPQMSAESRRHLLERARREGAILLTAHLPTPGGVRPAGGGWEPLG